METTKLFDEKGNTYNLDKGKKDRRAPVRGSRSFYLTPACGRKIKDDNGKEWQMSLIDLSVQLTAKQLQIFLRLNMFTDEYNVIYSGLGKISEKLGIHNRQQLSNIKSALIAAKAIAVSPIGNIMINPFMVLPWGNEGFHSQQIWKAVHYDKDAYFNGIDEAVNALGW